MDYYSERLKQELENIMEFWRRYAISGERFASQVSNEGKFSFSEPLGSLYVSRILYGSSAAARTFPKTYYHQIAELAYRTLRNQLSNPNGGYYWAADENGGVIHDPKHISFVQAFALYGLSEYYALTGESQVKREIYHQIDCIENRIKNVSDNSYLDGYDEEWNPLGEQSRSLGTHIHLLEAFTKFTEVTGDVIYRRNIENLLHILITRFISLQHGEIYHEFGADWERRPNENWAGHNFEVAWIVYKAARLTEKADLVTEAEKILITLCEKAIDLGFDQQYGGIINRFLQGEAITTNKEWWPQAEAVIACMYSYHVSHNKKFLSYAIRILEYIDNTFADHTYGEWFETVSREGMPLPEGMKLHLWKSMYHNVRYCIETINQLEALFVKAL
ncbi:MAG: AGE family epimerase/isomerase [Bacteroidales bacterium]|nr:AGE family epimerase/isomerase [Bacteroidales bacterium]